MNLNYMSICIYVCIDEKVVIYTSRNLVRDASAVIFPSCHFTNSMQSKQYAEHCKLQGFNGSKNEVSEVQ